MPAEDKAEGSDGRPAVPGRPRLSSLMFWVAYIACLFMLYALSSWLVKLMGMAGYSLGSALNFLLVYNAGASSAPWAAGGSQTSSTSSG